ncbi:hypothetical protein PVAND_004218 [Polypedilum vanderplanki]|uniref:trypsin n=1 Tax=Polypedilum vanderplanki TaxID=319348 RepID=A0A9J6BYF7_POLVA|nr:hypothetical protein PVAND_004218 [Polypedilum vanderplanki]
MIGRLILVVSSIFAIVKFVESGNRFGIVGGEETQISKFPHQIAYLYQGNLKCGGSIISSNCILTAGHCLKNFKTNLTIRTGSSAKSSGGTVHNVKQTILHPEFNSVKLFNDIALLLLETDIIFDANSKPIALPAQDQIIPDDTLCTVSGWGKMEDSVKPEYLRCVDVKTVNHDVCESCYHTSKVQFEVSEHMLCAGFLKGGRDSCTGDSGGPLVCEVNGKKIQVGVVSSGYGCAVESYPGIYTNIAKYRNWIESYCRLPKN